MCATFPAMGTLAEIRAAADQLPVAEQRILFQFIAERINRSEHLADDSVAAVIGAYRNGHQTTGEDAEDIFYGHDSNT